MNCALNAEPKTRMYNFESGHLNVCFWARFECSRRVHRKHSNQSDQKKSAIKPEKLLNTAKCISQWLFMMHWLNLQWCCSTWIPAPAFGIGGNLPHLFKPRASSDNTYAVKKLIKSTLIYFILTIWQRRQNFQLPFLTRTKPQVCDLYVTCVLGKGIAKNIFAF